MELKKITQNDPNVELAKVAKWLQNHPAFAEQKKVVNYKNYREPIRWYCQDCALILTSEMQAHEHFLGKKHKNVTRNKEFYNGRVDIGIKLSEQWSQTANSSFTCDKLKNSCYTGKYSFNNYLGPNYTINNLHNVIPPPASRDNILNTVIKGERRTFYSSDLSIYRTPSGKYYCQQCNLTVNSQAQFMQHSKSRKHKHKTNRASVKMK